MWGRKNLRLSTNNSLYLKNSTISERELRYMLSPVHLSVVCRLSVCLSVTFVRPTQAVQICGNRPWMDKHRKFHRDRPRGTPPAGELNTRGVAKYSDFGPIDGYISETVQCKIGGKLLLITNRKSYMSFRLLPKLVTLNDLERRNGRYFGLFKRIRVPSGRTA